MVKAQEWLENREEFIAKEKRKEAIGLYIVNESLEGELDLSDFVNLEALYCSRNGLTSLNISNCPNLKELYCSDNLLTDLNCRQNSQLEFLVINDNNFSEQDLSFLSHLVNLKGLDLSNKSKKKIEKGTYNRFKGSLEPLRNMTKLQELYIGNTDISSVFDCLPINLEEIDYSNKERKKSKVEEIEESLKKLGDFISVDSGIYKRTKNDAQQWLDENYPKSSTCINEKDKENFGKKRREKIKY